MLGTQGPADWAQATAGLLAGDRAWAGVHVAGEDILHLPLTKAGVKQAQALLAKYPKRGDFGAALLPPPAIQPRIGTGQTAPEPGPEHLSLDRHARGHPDPRQHAAGSRHRPRAAAGLRREAGVVHGR